MSKILECASCQQSIVNAPTKNIVKVHNQYFHREHLTCLKCKIVLEGKSYRVNNVCTVCLDCYMDATHPKCSGCGKILHEEALGVKNLMLHKSCLKCAECHLILKDKQFFSYNGLILDEDCYYTLKLGLRPGKQVKLEEPG